MFHDKKLSFTYSDIPKNLSAAWAEKIIPVFQSIMVANDKNTGISEIIKKISADYKLLPEYSIECFHAEIQVDYDPICEVSGNKTTIFITHRLSTAIKADRILYMENWKIRQMVECIKVYKDGKIDIIFGGGYKVNENLNNNYV